jgi:hypothetical protein
MPTRDEAWLQSVREGQARYWATVTQEQLAERRRKSAETRARNRKRYEASLRQRAEAERRAEARQERTRERRLRRLDDAALEVVGPTPAWTPTYVEPPGSAFPGPPSDGYVRPAYVLSRAKFWDFIEIDGPGRCWPWHGAPHPYWDDYGWASFMGSAQGAHRVAWMLHYRLVIPARWVGDHMCGCKWCCNPEHIEAIPHGENVRRNWHRPPAATRTRTSWAKPERWYPHGRRRKEQISDDQGGGRSAT